MSFCFSKLWYRGDSSDFDQNDMEMQFCIPPKFLLMLFPF